MIKWKIFVDDKLVRRWYGYTTAGEIRVVSRYHGKRVSKDCPLTHEEVREYVEKGAVKAVKFINDRRGIGLRESLRLLDKARKGK